MLTYHLTYHHERADLTFTWDGGVQIKIRRGKTVPRAVYPEWINVEGLPVTQDALQNTCDAWWTGKDPVPGLMPWREETVSWQYQDTLADGTRLNFVRVGAGRVHVTSPDTPHFRAYEDSVFVLHCPDEDTSSTLPAWLEDQARQWITTCNQKGRLVSTPGAALLRAPWRMIMVGPGCGFWAPFLSEEEAYEAARQAAAKATAGEEIQFLSTTCPSERASGERIHEIQVEQRAERLDGWWPHSHPWRKDHPSPEALTPLPGNLPPGF